MGGSPSYLDPVVIPLIKGPRILDVGCGFGKWGYLSTTNYWETTDPAPDHRPLLFGCDSYLPNILMAWSSCSYLGIVQMVFPPLPFADASFDTVLMVEVIEHLEADEVLALIEEAKRVARHRVIVSTPNYPDFRNAHRTITGFNEREAHLSYWSRRRLRQLGFSLWGAGWQPGSRYWRGALRRLSMVDWYDHSLRPSLGSLSLHFPFAAASVVGLWVKV